MAQDVDPRLSQILLGFLRNQTFIIQLMLNRGVVTLDEVSTDLSDMIESDRRNGASPDELFASEGLLHMVTRLFEPPLNS